MEFTEENLKDFVRQRSVERWSTDEKQPYWVSLIATDLKGRGVDYRDAIGDEKLKAFLKRTSGTAGYDTKEHPRHRAKVAVVPVGADFEFPHEEEVVLEDEPISPLDKGSEDYERVVVDFLRAIGGLSDELLDEVQLPAKILARLLVRR